MHRSLGLATVALLLAGSGGPARAAVDFGLTITDDGLRSFYLAIGDYYHVPEREITVVRERRIRDDALPVVFFLADRVGRPPVVIADMHRGGMSWVEIAWHFGLGSDIFYVALDQDPGPAYRRAYRQFERKRRGDWRHLRLADRDVVDLVNLRFISRHYACPPAEVMRLRGNHRSFVRLAEDVERGRGRHHGERHHSRGHEHRRGRDRHGDRND